MAERLSRTLLDMDRSMMAQAGLLPLFRPERVTPAVENKNTTAARCKDCKAAIELLTGRNTEVKVFAYFWK